MEPEDAIRKLKVLSKDAKPGFREGMARYGIVSDTALGIPVPETRKLAKEIEKNHGLALRLWKVDIHEAKMLASMIDDPELVSEKQMDRWARDFYSWDICDQCCGNLFDKTLHCEKKIRQWVADEREFVRRAGFVMMAARAVHDKKAKDAEFLVYLPLIKKYSVDKRNFVKKAVNWALRQIGKRNSKLHKEALSLAKKLASSPDKSARWIGSDARRELEAKKVK
jgi:3-methyladenine DNA glycosylase AlkD